MFLHFFFPRVLKIGFPTDFAFGVDTRFQSSHRICVVRNTEGIFVIFAVCTHLGCTPDWIPMQRIRLGGHQFRGPGAASDGEIVVDTSHLYSWPKGERSQFNDPGAILHA